jgi:CitMHS family citrate-Mg2+:H+ or citrate-Ca2+:H+ symporter
LVLVFGPFAQGSLSYGSAVILGTPIIFLFNNLGFNVTVVTAALSLIFPIGDCLPPSRIVGRLSIESVKYEEGYMSFLKSALVPILFMAAVALIMFIFPNQFKFLVIS